MTYDYDIASFTDVAPEWGDRLWAFLTWPDIVKRMTDASDARQPAAGAVGQLLLAICGEPVKQHRVRLFTGHLIRQVMEAQGYVIVDGEPTPTPDDPLFTRGATYRRA